LAKSEIINQPVLSNWQSLIDYLNAVMAREKSNKSGGCFSITATARSPMSRKPAEPSTTHPSIRAK
jgi:hypothetical protein